MDEAGADKFDGDLLGEDPVASFEAIVGPGLRRRGRRDGPRRRGAPVVRRLHGAGVLLADQPVPGPAGPRHRPGDRRGPGSARGLVQGLWDELAPNAEEWRTIGVFPAAVPVPEDAPLLHRLLGLTGRSPDPA